MAINVIKSRSPYYWINNTADLTSVNLYLYIYEGTQTTDRPIQSTIKLTATPINYLVYFDLSSIAKNYFEYNFNGTYENKVFYIDVQEGVVIGSVETIGSFTQLIVLDAYSNFEENTVPTQDTACLIDDNSKIRINYCASEFDSAEEVKIPVLANYTSSVDFYKGNTLIETKNVVPVTSGDNEIQYISQTIPSEIADHPTSVVINGTTLASSTIELEVNPFIDIKAENKLTYVNKNGVYVDFWLYGLIKETDTVKSTQYKRKSSVLDNLSDYYDTSRHNTSTLSKNGLKQLKIGSGFYDVAYNKDVQEILLSEKVWLNNKPVVVKNSSIQYKTREEDRLLSVEFELEYANNITNIGY